MGLTDLMAIVLKRSGMMLQTATVSATTQSGVYIRRIKIFFGWVQKGGFIATNSLQKILNYFPVARVQKYVE